MKWKKYINMFISKESKTHTDYLISTTIKIKTNRKGCYVVQLLDGGLGQCTTEEEIKYI